MSINSTGVFYLAGGTNVTLTQNINTISMSAPRPGGTTQLSRWEAPEDVFTGFAGSYGQGSLSIQHQYIPFNVTAQSARIAGSFDLAFGGLGGATSGSLSLWMGIYSLNGSSLSLASSGSANNSFTWNAALIGPVTSHIVGLRQITVPMNVNMTPGEYWVGAVMSTNGGYSLSMYGNNLVAAGNSSVPFLPIGLGTANTTAKIGGFIMYQGIHKTAAYTMPSSIAGTQIDNYNASNVQRADFYYALYNESNM
jgi:hypothetical protein